MQQSHLAIARTARWTRWTVIVLIGASLLIQASALLSDSPHFMLQRTGRSLPTIAGILLHAALMVLALIQIVLMLRHLERGELFSAGVTLRLRRFALLFMIAVLIGSVLHPLLTMLAADCPPGTRCVRYFPIDMRGLWTFVISLLFFLVARVIDEARRIADDHSQII